MTVHQKRSTKRVDFKLRYRWIESYPNGQTLTTETHEEIFNSVTEYYAKIAELLKKKEPSKGMTLEYIGWQITTEEIGHRGRQ